MRYNLEILIVFKDGCLYFFLSPVSTYHHHLQDASEFLQCLVYVHIVVCRIKFTFSEITKYLYVCIVTLNSYFKRLCVLYSSLKINILKHNVSILSSMIALNSHIERWYWQYLVLFPQIGKNVVYSKYAGTEIEFNGVSHLLLKEDDIVGILETDDIQDLQPLNDRVLIEVWLSLECLTSLPWFCFL